MKDWVLSQCKGKRRVSTIAIRFRAKELAKQKSINNLKCSNSCVSSLCEDTVYLSDLLLLLLKKFPNDWEEKVAAFWLFIKNAITEVNYQHIGNMDEVSISFDMTSVLLLKTKEQKVSKYQRLVMKNEFHCCIMRYSWQRKMLSLVIFKRKTIPKETFSLKEMVVSVSPKGWMTSDMFSFWLKNVWRKRKIAFFCSKSLLIYDSARLHITDEFHQTLPVVIIL